MKHVILLIVTMLFLSKALAAQDSGWNLIATPYLWIAKNEGSTGVFNDTASSETDIDIDFQDLFDHLEFAFMGNFRATKGDWLLYTEITVLDVRDDQADNAGPRGSIDVDVDVDIAGELIDLGAGYRVYQTNNLDLYGYLAVRYMNLDSTIKVDTQPDTLDVEADTGDDWIDPMIGIYSRYRFNDDFSLMGRAEMGGFGSEPSEAYLITITLDHRIAENWTLDYFYRFMSIDYADNGFIYDMEVSGPGIGASYHF